MLGVSVVVLDDMLIKRFASLLPGEGSISQLQYARTLMKVPMGVFGLAAGMAAFPTLSRLFNQQQPSQAYETLAQSIRMTMLLAFIAQAALSTVGTEIATVIWGETRFDAAVLNQIGLLTATYSLGLWAWSIQGLLARGYYAQGNTWTPTLRLRINDSLAACLSVVRSQCVTSQPCFIWGNLPLCFYPSLALIPAVTPNDWVETKALAGSPNLTACHRMCGCRDKVAKINLRTGLCSIHHRLVLRDIVNRNHNELLLYPGQ